MNQAERRLLRAAIAEGIIRHVTWYLTEAPEDQWDDMVRGKFAGKVVSDYRKQAGRYVLLMLAKWGGLSRKEIRLLRL